MASKKHVLEASLQDTTLIKRDFFGRIIEARPLAETTKNTPEQQAKQDEKERKVWVTYHEGLNNAVRKPMSLQEFMRGL
jgi:chromosome transmission fidelity protein 18